MKEKQAKKYHQVRIIKLKGLYFQLLNNGSHANTTAEEISVRFVLQIHHCQREDRLHDITKTVVMGKMILQKDEQSLAKRQQNKGPCDLGDMDKECSWQKELQVKCFGARTSIQYGITEACCVIVLERMKRAGRGQTGEDNRGIPGTQCLGSYRLPYQPLGHQTSLVLKSH